MTKDETLMCLALEYAHKAKESDNVPVGAIVVDSAENIIGIGWNQIETQKSQLAHAEILAIGQAIETIGDWRLDGCMLYVTLEPCMMCLGLVHLSRIKRCVFGTPSPLFGVSEFYGKRYANHTVEMVSGVLQNESSMLLKEFFKTKRVP